MPRSGDVAEWLGRGLQSLVHQFESGRRLGRKRSERVTPGACALSFQGMSRLTKLFAWIRPAAPAEDQGEAEEADQVDFDHESDKTSALAAPPSLQGQKFWEP